MLQVRAGHCPNCKEATPPGADYCPICGEDLNWQTVDGRKISGRSSPSGSKDFARRLVRNLIVFTAFALMAVIVFAFSRQSGKKPVTNAVTTNSTAKPAKGSTPSPGEDANSILDDALSDNDNSTSQSANNAVSNSVENSVSNSVNNTASDKGSTPSAEETPVPGNADDLSDLDFP